MVVGTVDRVIDHIRGAAFLCRARGRPRGALRRGGRGRERCGSTRIFRGGRSRGVIHGVICGCSPRQPARGGARDFVRDAEFVFAKFRPARQAVLFSRPALGEKEGLAAPSRSPVFLAAEDMQAGAVSPRGALVVDAAGGRSPEALARLLLGRAPAPALVLHSPRAAGRASPRPCAGHSCARRRFPRVPPRPAETFHFLCRREIEVLVLPIPPGGRLVQSELDELQPRTVLYYDIPGSASREGCGQAGNRSRRRRRSGIAVPPRSGDRRPLRRRAGEGSRKIPEAMAVTLQHAEVPGKDEVLGGAIARIVERIRSEADPKELARLRATIRRRVPFFMRSWFAAWLLQSHLPFEAESAQGQPRPQQGRPSQARPLQDRPSQARPLQDRPSQARPLQGRPTQARPLQGRPSQARPPGQPSRPAPVRSPSARPQSRAAPAACAGRTLLAGDRQARPEAGGRQAGLYPALREHRQEPPGVRARPQGSFHLERLGFPPPRSAMCASSTSTPSSRSPRARAAEAMSGSRGP